MRYFDPQPAAEELPSLFPTPFGDGSPCPLARRAALELQTELSSPLYTHLNEPGAGKMFGVLVVADPDGLVGYLRGFSGMLDGRWLTLDFAPPVFDSEARDAVWLDGELELAAQSKRIASVGYEGARAKLAELKLRHARAEADLAEEHRHRRAARRSRRVELQAEHETERELRSLDNESRNDKAERKRMRADHGAHLASPMADFAEREVEHRRLVKLRSETSQGLLPAIQATYRLRNISGTTRTLASLFAPAKPPGGAGDCAAPKLIAQAHAKGLTPIALAEFWWGGPPDAGGRRHGYYYPSCRGKCRPLIPFMLEGIDVAEAPEYGAEPAVGTELFVVYEDDWIIAVHKPHGLLSVPGRTQRLKDSIQTRLRAQGAAFPQLVHRLDLDTSGVVLLAKDDDTRRDLQKQFARREVTKRYIAWLDGCPGEDRGRIELPLRVDLDDRPRQIVDPVHGRGSMTDWEVLERTTSRTKVALYPRTGRTHQLRVHASHVKGIGIPIVGDRLYGRPGRRLMLHAESIEFRHPHTGRTTVIHHPAPF